MKTEVKSHMSGQPVSIEPDASALAALDLMIDHGIRHLPVVDGARRVCGVLSFDDLRAAVPVSFSLRSPLVIATTTIGFGALLWYADVKGPQTRCEYRLNAALDPRTFSKFSSFGVVPRGGWSVDLSWI